MRQVKACFYDYIYALVFISTARYENQVRRGKHHDGKIYFQQKPRKIKKILTYKWHLIFQGFASFYEIQ